MGFLRSRRAGRTLRLRSKRRDGKAAVRAVPILSELRCAPRGGGRSCAPWGSGRFRRRRKRRKRRAWRAAGEFALSVISGVSESAIGQDKEKAAWRRSRHLPQAKPHIFGVVPLFGRTALNVCGSAFYFYGRINSEDVKG